MKWIGPTTKDEWVSLMSPKRVDEWLQKLEPLLVQDTLSPDDLQWLEALRRRDL